MLAHNYTNWLRSLTVIRESEYATGKQKCANVGLVKACDAISANVGFYLHFQVSSSWLAVKQDSQSLVVSNSTGLLTAWSKIDPTRLMDVQVDWSTPRSRCYALHRVHSAVTSCLSIHLFYISVTCRYSVETAKASDFTFPLYGSHTILVFPHQMVWQYCNRDLLTRTSNAGSYEKIAIIALSWSWYKIELWF